jgi:hypothetical protein
VAIPQPIAVAGFVQGEKIAPYKSRKNLKRNHNMERLNTSGVGLDQNSFVQKIKAVLVSQDKDYSAFRFAEGTIDEGETKKFLVDVTSLGPFKVDRITGTFETLFFDGTNIVDDGVCYLSAKIRDAGRSRTFMDEFVPLNLLLSPGRIRSSKATNNVTTAAPSQQLYFPFDFEYIFGTSSKIEIEVKNSGNTDMSFEMLFTGRRIVEPSNGAFNA